jgi:hypothetical protein
MFGCTCNEVLLEQLREIADCHERTLHFQRFLERVDGDISLGGGGGLNAKKIAEKVTLSKVPFAID